MVTLGVYVIYFEYQYKTILASKDVLLAGSKAFLQQCYFKNKPQYTAAQQKIKLNYEFLP